MKLDGVEDYLYFGAAKDLPGVRELFQRELPEPPRKNRSDLFKNIDLNVYYGRTEDSKKKMLESQRAEEQKLKQAQMQKWKQSHDTYLKEKF